MPTISVCIPTYEMKGLGTTFLKESFDILTQQTFKDFDIIISDHSKDDSIKNLCEVYRDTLTIHYYRNDENRGSSSANINNAIRKAQGRLIKILFQDDFLKDRNSLEIIARNFDLEKDHWLVTACAVTEDGKHYSRLFYPKYNSLIHLGHNTIGSPSVVTIKNTSPHLFDETLIWLMDCDYYKRCYTAFGKPKVVHEIVVANRIGTHQVTNAIVTLGTRIRETFYILKKYARY